MGTALFDGGSMAGTTGCAQAGNTDAATSMPAPSTLRAGRVGIPLGSTEIAGPGLSPMPPLTPPFVSPVIPLTLSSPATTTTMGAPPAPLTPPCPVIGTFTGGSTRRQAVSNAGSGTAAAPGC